MPRVLHFGLGAFHRAHQAAFTQDAGGWQIESVSMRNPALSDALNAAGGRWHLVERAPDGPRVRLMTVIDRAHCLATDPAGTVARMTDPEVQVVTATVTEKGYGFHPATRHQVVVLNQNQVVEADAVIVPTTLPHGVLLQDA